MAKNNSINNRADSLTVCNTLTTEGVILSENAITCTNYDSNIYIVPTNTHKITSASTDANGNSFMVTNIGTSNHGTNLILKTASTSGKAYHKLSTTTNTWTLGSTPIDASNTKFVISPSATFDTNNVLEIREGGEVNFPKQPSFLAYVNGSVLNVTGDGSGYTVLFDEEVWDTGSDYNPATGKFQAPRTGKYHFSFSVLLGGIVDGDDCVGGPNTAAGYKYQFGRKSPAGAKDSSNQVSLSGEYFLELTVGDEVNTNVRVYNESGGKVNDVIGHATNLVSYFSGRLVC